MDLLGLFSMLLEVGLLPLFLKKYIYDEYVHMKHMKIE